MSECLIESHRDTLEEIIRVLCNGDTPTELMQQFSTQCDSISQNELSYIFNNLDAEGIDFRSSDLVIDYFHSVVEEKIAAAKLQQFATGHPARVYLEENILLRAWIKKILPFKPTQDLENFKLCFNDICRVELHYQRKENQLFPCLEQHGWDSPSKNMWALHDDNRAMMKEIRLAIDEGNAELAEQKTPFLLSELERMMQIEEQRLLPNAMDLLDEDDWLQMRTGDEEIGWMLEQTPPPYPAYIDDSQQAEPQNTLNTETLDSETQNTATVEATTATKDSNNHEAKIEAAKVEEYIHPSEVKRKKKLPFDTTGMFHFDEGYMTPEQVNLIFKTLPMDITYVDENDKVLFYNRGQERLFPRSAGIIGREVHLCHPPKSVDTVLRIVEEFKKGTRDVADFRINIKGRFVLIRYFAVRDNEQNYRGVLEMSQDITDIQTLEGEQRLLDWN